MGRKPMVVWDRDKVRLTYFRVPFGGRRASPLTRHQERSRDRREVLQQAICAR